jgi:outer membrane lipoprotein carrier protein
MKFLLFLFLVHNSLFADLSSLNSFEADFKQTITDDKGESLSYKGSVKALKPNLALWTYYQPIEKTVYIKDARVTIVEPEIEQVMIRDIKNDFDFFSLLSRAKKIDNSNYVAHFEDQKVYIKYQNGSIYSLTYKDKLENDVKIVFSKQEQNRILSTTIFDASYPPEYDIIKE